ncbi:MAG: lysophospholipid acyltransferase family protein [Actinomycetes bacterium]
MEIAYPVAAGLLRLPLRHGLRWRTEGIERIPDCGGAILASNHVSYLDPLVVGMAADRRHRRIRFLAKEELFRKQPLAGFLRAAGQIPVARGTADAAAALDAAVTALRDGECVVVFPEGTISLDLEPMAGRTGTARLAAASGVAVTPVGVWGAHRIMFKGRPPRWRAGVAVSVVVGEPVAVRPDDDPRVATDRIMAGVCAAVARAREIYPQTPGADEDDWWVRGPATAVVRPCGG